MPDFAAPVERLIDELKHLPGMDKRRLSVSRFICCGWRRKMRWRWRMRFAMPKKKFASARFAGTSRTPTHVSIAPAQTAASGTICVVEEPHKHHGD